MPVNKGLPPPVGASAVPSSPTPPPALKFRVAGTYHSSTHAWAPTKPPSTDFGEEPLQDPGGSTQRRANERNPRKAIPSARTTFSDVFAPDHGSDGSRGLEGTP